MAYGHKWAIIGEPLRPCLMKPDSHKSYFTAQAMWLQPLELGQPLTSSLLQANANLYPEKVSEAAITRLSWIHPANLESVTAQVFHSYAVP